MRIIVEKNINHAVKAVCNFMQVELLHPRVKQLGHNYLECDFLQLWNNVSCVILGIAAKEMADAAMFLARGALDLFAPSTTVIRQHNMPQQPHKPNI